MFQFRVTEAAKTWLAMSAAELCLKNTSLNAFKILFSKFSGHSRTVLEDVPSTSQGALQCPVAVVLVTNNGLGSLVRFEMSRRSVLRL